MLSESDQTALGKYLKSQFFTNKKYLYPLFLLLRASAAKPTDSPEESFSSEESISSEESFLKIFPEKETFDRHKWNKALSDLNGQIEDFMVIQHFQKTQDLLGLARIDAFYEKGDESLFQHAVDAVLSPSSKKPVPEKTDRWGLRYWSRKRSVTYQFDNQVQNLDKTLDSLEDDLDTFYLISKIQIVCNRISAAQFLKQPDLLESPQRLLEQAKPLASKDKSHLLMLYCSLLGLFLEADTSFSTFFEALKKHGLLLDRRELEVIVRFGFNYCIDRHRQGQAQALDWHLSLYTWSNAQSVWTKASTEELFLNLGVLFAKTNHLAQFDTLIETGINSLPSKRKANALSLLTAYRHFYQGEYGAAQTALVLVTIRHPRYVLLRHSLAVRNAYMLLEQKEFEIMQVEWAALRFEDFLNRQKTFAQSFCKSYHELIWFIQRLAERDTPPLLLEQALVEKQPAARDWVATMIGRLSN